MYDAIGMIPLPMAPKSQSIILRPEPWMLSESGLNPYIRRERLQRGED